MDIDENQATLDALDALSTLLPALEETPLSYKNHYQYLHLTKTAGLDDQLTPARESIAANLAVADDIWLPLLEAKIRDLQSQTPMTSESSLAIEALFEQAESDYLSIPILKMHLEYLISQHALVTQESNQMSNELSTVYSTERISEKLKTISSKADIHFSRSHEVWDARIEWEESMLQFLSAENRSARSAALQAEFLERLETPHLNHAQTFQNYSTFISSCFPAEIYEEALVKATGVRQDAVKVADEREKYELNLKSLHDYSSYLAWEASPKFVRTKGKGKDRSQKPEEVPPNPKLAIPLYERAIAEAAKRRADVLSNADLATVEGPLAEAEAWLAAFWEGLIAFVKEYSPGKDTEMPILQRAVRSMPSNGSIIASFLRSFYRYRQVKGNYNEDADDDVNSNYESDDDESEEDEDEVPDKIESRTGVHAVYVKAMNSGLLDAAGITAVTIPRASYEDARIYRDGFHGGDEKAFQNMKRVLETGIARVREKGGDPTLKLEKYLSKLFMTLEEPLPDDAEELWEGTVKFYKKSYLAFSEYTRFLIGAGKHREVRIVFKDAANPSRDLDYPQALWDAWMLFEELYGSFEDIEYALMRVRKLGEQLAKKNAKIAEREAYNQAQYATSSNTWQDGTYVPRTIDDAMAVDEVPPLARPAANSHKRKADDDLEDRASVPEVDPHASKKTKPDMDAPLKRDRENSTVFVGGLWDGVDDIELKKLFKDCGEIREVKITKLANEVVALIEFMEKESVPAALTKDKKRLQGNEVAVHLAWRSTLYVTNFPETSDDAWIRQLFTSYGTLFDVRWPSKKYKSTRRFCYVQFVSPQSAQAALELNGRELEPGHPMNVYISNPERKKERTDANVEQREIYVAGLAKSTSQADLETLFKECGAIKGVRVPLDDKGKAKGFAFVEFEQETSALKALAFNNMEVKKRRIAVTMVDPRAPSRRAPPASGLGHRADQKSRSVRIRNIPAGTQEGLLQQAIEKVAFGIKKVELFEKTGQAVVEFNAIADAGKFLLLPGGLPFEGANLPLSEEGAPAATANAVASSSSFVPRATGKPKAGLGFKKPTISAVSKSSAGSGQKSPVAPRKQVASSASSGKDQDAFRAMLEGRKS